MLKIITFFGICFLLFSLNGQNWTAAMYKRYNYKNFPNSTLAQQRIDQNKVDYGLLHAAIFYVTNATRQKKGRALLKYEPRLEKAAEDHSKDMVRHRFFEHISPISGKKTPADRIKNFGIVASTGENIIEQVILNIKAKKGQYQLYSPAQNGGYFSLTFKGKPLENHTYLSLAQKCVQRWMKSKGHRKIMLHKIFKYLGCGCDLKINSPDKPPQFTCTQNYAGDLH